MYEVKQNSKRRIMDREVFNTETLPEDYKCIDVTEQFVLSDKGLRLSRRHKWGLAFIGKHAIGEVHTLRSVMKAMEDGKTGYMVLAIDRVWKELMYVCL